MTNTAGDFLHRLEDAYKVNFYGIHTVNSRKKLIYIDKYKKYEIKFYIYI